MAKIRRNNKQWAKTQAATKEIQENLFQIAAEKVTGGEELFFIDKAGDQGLKKLGLKSYEVMINTSFIPPIIAKKTAKTTKKLLVDGSKEKNISKNILHSILEKAKIKKAKGLLPGSAVASKRKKAMEKRMHIKHCKGGFDMWGNEGESVAPPPIDPCPEMRKIEVKPRRIPLSYTEKDSRPTMIPAVSLPHPGTSYKPTEKDHNDIIIAAADEELKKIAKKEKTEEALAYPPELDLLDDDDGFFNDSSDEDEIEKVEASEEAEMATGDVESKKPNRKLTKAEINKKERHKAALQEEKAILQQKSLIKQINKLKEIKKSIASKENIDEIKRKEKQLKRLIKAETAPRRTSRLPFNPVPIAAQLPEELATSLRELQPEGGLLKDRFRSLQERGAIEVRVPVNMKRVQKKRWGRFKEVESHDYKRFK